MKFPHRIQIKNLNKIRNSEDTQYMKNVLKNIKSKKIKDPIV